MFNHIYNTGVDVFTSCVIMLTDVFVNYIEDICLADVIAKYMRVADVITTKADAIASAWLMLLPIFYDCGRSYYH